MFKRLRDNLFGRPLEPDEQGDALEQAPEHGEPRPDTGDADSARMQSSQVEDEIAVTSEAAIREDAALGRDVPDDTADNGARHQTAASALDGRGQGDETAAGEPPAPTASGGASASIAELDDAEEADLEYADSALSDHERQGGFKNPFRFSLGRTRQLFGRVNEAFQADEVTEDLWDELEETLISSDVGVTTTERLLRILRERATVEDIQRGSQLRDALKEELDLLLGEPDTLVFSDTSPLTIYLVVGVNGVGKTTSIAKLANVLKRQKHRVMLAAADTFRAAATEQIKLWGERIGVPVISHQYGADPAAVVYDAVQAAQARGTDVLIVDTAGRLHTKYNLMEELKKIGRVLQKYDAEAPHEVLLVIDATTGQNGYLQAKQFIADAGVSGIILTKLDGTARGGIVFAIASELGLPIKYIGTGEKVNDIAPFDPVEFVDALFED
jgi:fused signal recognition particle receptor